MNYWDTARPTYIENWPAAMCSLSVAQADIPLTLDEARDLGSNIMEFGESFGLTRPADISSIRRRVADAVDSFPSGAFVRLGSRSPKDSWEGHETGLKVESGTDPLRFVLDASERVYEDLALALKERYAPHIFVRQWLDIPKWAEFRCFMRDRRFEGISQYHYLEGEVFDEIVDNHKTIDWVIRDQFFHTFRDACHLESVVFDVILKRWPAVENTYVWECRLLEINPYYEMTDPCLFQWGRPIKGFRFNGYSTATQSGSKRLSSVDLSEAIKLAGKLVRCDNCDDDLLDEQRALRCEAAKCIRDLVDHVRGG